jgi:hypothetical protein
MICIFLLTIDRRTYGGRKVENTAAPSRLEIFRTANKI